MKKNFIENKWENKLKKKKKRKRKRNNEDITHQTKVVGSFIFFSNYSSNWTNSLYEKICGKNFVKTVNIILHLKKLLKICYIIYEM